jgi:hypothetical protein
MDRQVKLVENNLVLLQSSTNSIDEKIEKMKADMERKIIIIIIIIALLSTSSAWQDHADFQPET